MRRWALLLLTFALVVLPPLAATTVAADSPRREQRTLTVTTDDGRHYRVELDPGEELVVTDLDSGEQVCDLDLAALREELAEAVQEATTGVGEALAALHDLSLNVNLGEEGNRIRVRYDGGETVVDLDAVLQRMHDAIGALAESRADHAGRARREEADVDSLKVEVQRLQQQIDALEKELRAVRRRARH